MRRGVHCLAIGAMLVFLFLAGCMRLGPDFHSPRLGFKIPDSYRQEGTGTPGKPPGDRWWQTFADPELDRLVEEALKHNLDIQKATARILELKSRLVQTHAGRLPSLGLQAEAGREKRQIIGFVPGMSLVSRTDTHAISFPASFELDLWGRLARAEEAARADILSAEETRRTIAQGIVAETITLYFQVIGLERQIEIAERSVENFRRRLSLVEHRYERGLTSLLNLRQARRALAQTEALLPELYRELGLAQHRISLLVGRYPELGVPSKQRELYLENLEPVPTGLPSQLLLRRPDIRAAEAQLRSLNAMIGVAKASRFPKIALTGNLGYASEALTEVLRHDSELWSIALGIVQPLFDGGALKAGQRVAEARYAQGLAQYAKTVLTAFAEVESALLTRKKQMERREKILGLLEETRAMEELTEARYQRGLVDYLAVLDARAARFQAERDLVLVDLALVTNRVTLHRALGGGWADPGRGTVDGH